MKEFRWNNTICVFTKDAKVISETRKFAEYSGMNILEAEMETDLVGYPYCIAVIDEKLLTNGIFLEYLTDLNEIQERIISHTNSGIEEFRKYFKHPSIFNFYYLNKYYTNYIIDVNNGKYS